MLSFANHTNIESIEVVRMFETVPAVVKSWESTLHVNLDRKIHLLYEPNMAYY